MTDNISFQKDVHAKIKPARIMEYATLRIMEQTINVLVILTVSGRTVVCPMYCFNSTFSVLNNIAVQGRINYYLFIFRCLSLTFSQNASKIRIFIIVIIVNLPPQICVHVLHSHARIMEHALQQTMFRTTSAHVPLDALEIIVVFLKQS